jgi:hypothetical protein
MAPKVPFRTLGNPYRTHVLPLYRRKVVRRMSRSPPEIASASYCECIMPTPSQSLNTVPETFSGLRWPQPDVWPRICAVVPVISELLQRQLL